MKKIILLLILFPFVINAQIGIGTNTPNTNSILEMVSTTKGFLMPRLTQAERDAITLPAHSLLIYQTDNTNGFYYNKGTAGTPNWVLLQQPNNTWELSGNVGLTAANYLGTTNNQDLIFKTTNTIPLTIELMRIDSASNFVGIGTATPTQRVHIVGSGIPPVITTDVIYQNNMEAEAEGNLSTNTTADPYRINSGGKKWKIQNGPSYCSACNGNYLSFKKEASSNYAVFGPFTTATGTSITINFDYGTNHKDTGSYTGRFRVYLYNETTTANVLILDVNGTTTDTSASIIRAVTPGDTYTLRFRANGPSTNNHIEVDNIEILGETVTGGLGASIVQINDGNERLDYILTSDANGYARWTDPIPVLADKDWAFMFNSGNDSPIFRTGAVRVGSAGAPRNGALLDIYNGANDNSTFGVGSVESIIDFSPFGNNNEDFYVYFDLTPISDITSYLGTSSNRWSEIFGQTIITTSDERLKENMQPLHYGLEELMKLRPVSYYWKDDVNNEKRKIGFIAQELKEVLPEIVQTEEWVRIDEKELLWTKKPTAVNGVSYSEMIPVVIKAIQEKQVIIDEIAAENENLRKRIEALKK